MKKLLFVFSIVFALISMLFLGCASSLLYKIENNEIANIDGTIYVTSMPVYLDISALYYSDKLALSKVRQNGVEYYRLEVECYLSEWLFIDTLKIKIDGGATVAMEDKNPHRKVIPGTVGTAYSVGTPTRVLEVAHFILDDNIVNQLKNCNSFVFQHKREPVTIPQEGITAIKNFLKGD